MQTVTGGTGGGTDGAEFGPVTDKLVRDLLNAGARLTAQVTVNPDQLGPRLHAYTVEVATALAMAVDKLESSQTDPAVASERRRPKRPSGSGHLAVGQAVARPVAVAAGSGPPSAELSARSASSTTA